MASINRVILTGRLVADPDVRKTNTGKSVVSFRLAVDRYRRAGEESSTADFIPVTAWERLADTCERYLTKGYLVAIEGRLQTGSYTDKDGNKRSKFEVVADNMQMLSRPARQDQGQGGYNGGAPSGRGSYGAPSGGDAFADAPFNADGMGDFGEADGGDFIPPF